MRLLKPKEKGKYWYYGVELNNGVYLKISNLRPEAKFFGYYKSNEETSFDEWTRSFGFGSVQIECSRLHQDWLQ